MILVPIWDWDLTWLLMVDLRLALPLLMLLLPLLQLLLPPIFRFFFRVRKITGEIRVTAPLKNVTHELQAPFDR